MKKNISFIVPIYNRPEEMEALLKSLSLQTRAVFEIVIVEDGSTLRSDSVVDSYKGLLPVTYYYKENSGPGPSRNYGMARAKGDYFIILDSDCELPTTYLETVENQLKVHALDFFGGPDAAHTSFTNLQKAINFVMTSWLTTAGVRGAKKTLQRFEPRSFNMGISKDAFNKSGGFGNIHPGEDPDLSIRLWEMGFKSGFIEKAFVYHKRRINWFLFYKQVYAFGSVRPILMKKFPSYAKPIYWLPSLFLIGFFGVVICAVIAFYFPALLLVAYLAALFLLALYKEKSILVACMVWPAFLIQMCGYGYGFLKSCIVLRTSKLPPEQLFPHLFFK